MRISWMGAVVVSTAVLFLGCEKKSESELLDRYQASLVELEIARKGYNYRLPWVTQRSQTKKNGVIIEGRKILTTADDVSGHVLVRAQKNGESRKFEASFLWIDYYANLAVIEVEDDEFWKGLKPVSLANRVPNSGLLQILRWRSGRLETRSAEIERLFVGKGQMSYIEHLQLEVSSEIEAAGWAEVVVQNDRVVGLSSSANGKSLTVIPSVFIKNVIQGWKSQEEAGLGYFDFAWQFGTNRALLESKGWNDPDRGVVVTRVGDKGLGNTLIKPGDIILEVDGFSVDVEGKYVDPRYGRLLFDGLATRERMANDSISIVVWRDGKKVSIDYELPKAEFDRDLIPDADYDETPEYYIAGGLLFQPLTGGYLSAFGKNQPFLIRYYDYERPVADRQGLVVLSAVMPDPYNRGYEDASQLIVDTVNGNEIENLGDLIEAFEAPEGDYHVIKFFQDQPLKTIVLDSNELGLATARVLKRYRVPEDRYLLPEKP
ncbi:MAG: hypothetical protein AAF558_08685 [Verrucomicrobiota bacterium]